MVKIIPRDPIPDPDIFSLMTTAPLPYPFGEKDAMFFGFGRTAIYEGLRLLNIRPEQGILLPNYICNAVMPAIHHLRLAARFYKVNEDLRPDWQSVERDIDNNTKALLVVNYFGFPNDLSSAKKICEKYKLFLIEDNAHGFLSYDGDMPLGARGDISIFSFRKTLPIPNGAALVVNNKSLVRNLGCFINTFLRAKADGRFIIKSFLRRLKYHSGIRFRRNKAVHFSIDPQEEFNMDKCLIKFSQLGNFMIRHFNLKKIIGTRRNNYMQWLDFFSKNHDYRARIIFPLLPGGVVPYVFPVLVENREYFISDMWRRGIECFPWPFLPKDSGESYLSRRMVCLPVFPCFRLSDFFSN